jgi:predicted nucleotidyltransferase
LSEAQKKPPIEALPSDVRAGVAAWTRSLEETLGDDLVGILVHGSVARGEYRPGESDVDAVVVLREATFGTLDSIAQAMQLGRYAARIEAMILTEAEIPGASDVFPLLYDEIKRCHFLLAGRDPFADVVVHDRHRRLRVEQELREARLRLRRSVIEAAGAREALGGSVARKLRQVRQALHALLQMKGIVCSPDTMNVLGKAGEIYAVDVAPLRSARETPEAAHAAFAALLDRAIDDANALPPASERMIPIP